MNIQIQSWSEKIASTCRISNPDPVHTHH